jgi:hypothetical protein
MLHESPANQEQNELSDVRIMVAIQVAQTRNVAGQQTLQLHISIDQINCFQTLYDLRALGFQRCAREHAPNALEYARGRNELVRSVWR